MKDGSAASVPKRPYRMRARAAGTAATRQRILAAAVALYSERWLDQITLEAVAERAGVTLWTVLRHFGSKEGLFDAAAQEEHARIERQRDAAPVGDIAGAVRNLMAHYEEVGDQAMRFLAQEERYPALRPPLESGRAYHQAWVARTFAPFLVRDDGQARARLLAEAVAVTDVYVWKLLRRDLGLDRGQAELALQELLTALFAREGR